ncbi:DNA/RNA helicase [Cinnamomum micranthum f. kanehirae]|uniref:DNA/RNA helicase n=1 Tax=Cinnamomum micranthum f. kanehirae TaxID=337451 RepID=A0A3S3N170_9MAGN|nr:DNA/RNA helicase [Cinnamomum micranthum f. kanehirae]
MAKGEDAVRKKRNKSQRKKLRKESSVTARVASIIAAKRRRKMGKRRVCESMCFSLPTPEDPFNDKNDKMVLRGKKPEKPAHKQVDAVMTSARKGAAAAQKPSPGHDPQMVEQQALKKLKVSDRKDKQNKLLESLSNKYHTVTKEFGNSKVALLKEYASIQQGSHGSTDCVSKFLILCLNAIQNSWMHEGTFDGKLVRPLLANVWGVEFWKLCSVGSDILETTGACSSREQIAWLVSTAADVFTRKEKEGQIIGSPFLLFVVPSQDKAIKVRSVCKPLKGLGIHTVSLHPGASLDHQVLGLKSCEPEFLVSTPERLLELVSLRAIDISSVSLLVFDGLENFVDDGLLETIKFIRQCVSGEPQMVIFSDCSGDISTSLVKNLMRRPVSRLSLNNSISTQSACISQCVHLYTSEGENVSKAVHILNHACNVRECSWLLKALFITGTTDQAQALATSLSADGFYTSNANRTDDSQDVVSCINLSSEKGAAVTVMDKDRISMCQNIEEFEIVIFVDFPSVDGYTGILTKMARHSVDGAMHIFLHEADVLSAGPLIKLLEQCSQPVPETLKNCLYSS